MIYFEKFTESALRVAVTMAAAMVPGKPPPIWTQQTLYTPPPSVDLKAAAEAKRARRKKQS